MQPDPRSNISVNAEDRERIKRDFSFLSSVFTRLMGAKTKEVNDGETYPQEGDNAESIWQLIDGASMRVEGGTTYITIESILIADRHALSEPATITVIDGDRSSHTYVIQMTGSSSTAN